MRLKHLLGDKTQIGKTITVKGWVRSLRKSKAFCFIVLNDGSTLNNLQIIADDKLENYEQVSKMITGFCVAVTGEIVESQGKGQGIEMQASQVEIYGGVTDDYPLQKKGTSLEFLREIQYLRPRTNTFGAVFRIRHTLAFATHEFFNNRDFYYLNSPIITANDGEGAGEIFRISNLDLNNPPRTDKGEIDYSQDFFGQQANLTVTGQLEGEAFAMGLGQVYTFGPTFRAENSNTSRHLAEFWMIEPEVAFAELEDIAKLGTDYIQYLLKSVLEKNREDLEFLQKHFKKDLIETLEHVAKSDFVQITYTEAIDILQKEFEKNPKGWEFKPTWGEELHSEQERFLTEKHFKLPVIVTDYPREAKAFYMKVNPDQKTVRAMDILVPGIGEIVGGSQREEDLDVLLENMKQKNIPVEDLEWYVNLRKFGTCPHAGFGLGFERMVMYATGMSNIRDVIAFSRAAGQLGI